MSSFGLNDLYESAEQGGAVGLPDGNYDLKVTGARPRAESRLVFIDFVVLNGPSAGKTLQANLYIPDGTNGGAAFHFRKKVKGFLNPTVKAAFALADSAGSFEDALDIIADALVGTELNANIGLQKEGKYKGNNEIQSSEPLAGSETAAPAPAPQPAAAPAEAPAQVTEPIAQAPAAPAEASVVPF